MADPMGDEDEGRSPSPSKLKRRRRWGELDHQTRDNVIVGIGALGYAAVLGWPLYNLAIGRSRPENFTLLGGLIGLMLAAYAVMTNRMEGAFRWIAGAIGMALLVICWGFGPL